MSRFIINLVALSLDDDDARTGSRWSQMSSLRFSMVQTVVGNLGAPLSDGLLDDDEGEDVGHDETEPPDAIGDDSGRKEPGAEA